MNINMHVAVLCSLFVFGVYKLIIIIIMWYKINFQVLCLVVYCHHDESFFSLADNKGIFDFMHIHIT